MAQAFHLDLSGVGKGAVVHQMTNAAQVLLLVGALNLVFNFVADIKVVFNCAFVTPGDNRHIADTGSQSFLHAKLNQGFVDNRQHFLGHGLGRGQESGAIAGSRKQTFFNHSSLPVRLASSTCRK